MLTSFSFLVLRTKANNIVANGKNNSGRIILFNVISSFSSTMDVIITKYGNILQGHVFVIDNGLILNEKY